MDFLCACVTEKSDYSCACGSAYYGIIYHYNTLARNALTYCIELYLYGVLTLILTWLDKASADVFVLDEADSVGDTAFICVTESGVQSRIGNTDDYIRRYGTVLCQNLTCLKSCVWIETPSMTESGRAK